MCTRNIHFQEQIPILNQGLYQTGKNYINTKLAKTCLIVQMEDIGSKNEAFYYTEIKFIFSWVINKTSVKNGISIFSTK